MYRQVYLTTRLRCSGRGLGGSTNMNFMVWQRPPAEEIDGNKGILLSVNAIFHSPPSLDFERLGNPGWNWRNLHKYMKMAEKCALDLWPANAILITALLVLSILRRRRTKRLIFRTRIGILAAKVHLHYSQILPEC